VKKSFVLSVQEGVDKELYLQLNDEILEASGFKIGDKLQWINNKDGSWSIIKVDDNLNYFVVDVLSTFRNRYVVKAKGLDDAMDEVVFNEHDPDFKEFSQKHLGTQVFDGRQIEYADLLELSKKDNDYISTWTDAEVIEQLTNTIDYKD
jgi:hypothetical protein